MAMKKRTNKFGSVQKHLLIAMPSMEDPHFNQAVIYIHQHNQEGAMGIMINRPIGLTVGGLLEQLDLPVVRGMRIENNPLLLGGPLEQKHGFVLHLEAKDIVLSASKDVLKTIAEGKGPQHAIISLGYSGWEAGELEREIMGNHWLLAPPDPRIFFNTPFKDRWKAAASLVGVDFNFMYRGIGRA